jgi:hypothetical protein
VENKHSETEASVDKQIGQTRQRATLGHLPGAPQCLPGMAKDKEVERPCKGMVRTAPGRAQEPPLLGQARPGSRGQLGLIGQVKTCVGNMRGTCTLALHHGADRHRPAPWTGVIARCPSCHIIIMEVSAPHVAVHWPRAPPTYPSHAWLHPIEPGNAVGLCSNHPLRPSSEVYMLRINRRKRSVRLSELSY